MEVQKRGYKIRGNIVETMHAPVCQIGDLIITHCCRQLDN